MFYENETDETLVMLTLAGEQSAYEVLVVRYQRAVTTSAISVTHNQYMAEDAAQDAFVTAWMKLNTLQERAKFSAWVCRIAKNCALNMVMRFRSYLPLETVENLSMDDGQTRNPAEFYAMSEERDELHKSIGKLPDRVREIINLHYFEGLSIAEIADRMRISEGTVKWQLHDGRKRIRKELCAMNEKYSDTFVQRVMKKVAELKLWQFKNDKSGFEIVYQDVLRDVENLPESQDKNNALADVLLRGWWWLPGEKSDALLKRIADAALRGKNEEVMTFIVMKEDSRFWGSSKTEFMRYKQIPRLEAAGFLHTLGREWFWLGYDYFREGKVTEGKEAYEKVRDILTADDAYYNMAPYALKMENTLSDRYRDKNINRYLVGSASYEFRYTEGGLRFWKEETVQEGDLGSIDREISRIFRNSSLCDSRFTADIGVGETFTGSDGSTLTFASDSETVKTPAGIFENCQLWITVHTSWHHKSVFKTYYKDGTGIVKHEHMVNGVSDIRLLSSYHIAGGSGLLPMAQGNRWEYASEYPCDVMRAELAYEVSFADETKVLLTSWENAERLKYDENSWTDMVQQIANEYYSSDTDKVYDVSHAIERAEALAKTPVEKAYTKAAASVARRIMDTNPLFNQNNTATGHWNFFERSTVTKENGSIVLSCYDGRWDFELKDIGGQGNIDTPLLFNDIFGILQDATRYIWSDEWRIGASPVVEYNQYDSTIKTQIVCGDGGSITTKAGTFDHCLRLSMEISGLSDGLGYRSGKKVYYFADGVGIVRTENEYCDGAKTAVYELTAYEGTGEGYMPVEDGMHRRYDALGLTDGYVGAAEYTFVADGNGDIFIFSDRTGIRRLPPSITQYSSIQGEIQEDNLWNTDRYDESRLRHDVNNFHLLCHFFGRPSRYWNAQEKAVAWNKYRMQIMEGLGENGEVPAAWMGHYSSTCFRTACALFGCGRKEEGYEYLEKAFGLFFKWDAIRDGEEMEVGNPLIYGGIKVIKGKSLLRLPDGTMEPITYTRLFEDKAELMLYGMTAPHGWEWFDSVRDEEHFKEYIERAREMAESNQ